MISFASVNRWSAMADVHELAATLRKALENTKTAILAFERAVAQQMDELSRERAALDADRQALEDERVQQERDAYDEEEQCHEEGSQAEGQAGAYHDAPVVGRARDRSRSRNRSRSNGTTDPVQVAATRLGLDGTALKQIQQFPHHQALNMLDQIPEDVRNPSAFVTKMCQRAHQTRDDTAASDTDRIERAVLDLGLDESAARALRDLPREQAVSMLDQVDGNVRNPSAFIMSLARANKGKGSGRVGVPGPSIDDRIDEHVQRLALDQSAVRMLTELSPEYALSILDLVGDDVRNPSAYVTAEARKALAGGGKGRHEGGSATAASATKEFAQQIDQLAKSLDLDESCLDALHNISAQDAVQILERLAVDISTIRNRSAFVFAEVKKRTRGTPQPSATTKSQGGGSGTSRIPCKFFAEGRCKNGNDCRFSHA